MLHILLHYIMLYTVQDLCYIMVHTVVIDTELHFVILCYTMLHDINLPNS